MQSLDEQKSFESETFRVHEMAFHFKVSPNGDCAENGEHLVLAVCLEAMPSASAGIVVMRYDLGVKETQTRFISEAMYRKGHMASSWGAERLTTATFRSLKAFT